MAKILNTLRIAAFVSGMMAPTLALAFGGALIDASSTVLNGHDTTDTECKFSIYHDENTISPQVAEVKMFSGGTHYSGGSYWDAGIGGGEVRGTDPAIDAALIESLCDLTNVTITSNIGADPSSSYSAQDWMGLEFRGTRGADGITYVISGRSVWRNKHEGRQ